MASALQHFVTRPLIAAWLAGSRHSWRRHVVAADAPLVHARGTDADRVLIAGDGAATGRGVLTHDLGLPGFLARSLAAHTGRAADVDILVASDMTAASCRTAIMRVDLFRFDVVVLTVGANEALSLMSTDTWRIALDALLSDIAHAAPSATRVFLLAIPLFGNNPRFPQHLATVVDNHVADLNEVMQELVAVRPEAQIVLLRQGISFEHEGPHLYQKWAEEITPHISAALNPARSSGDDKEKPDEPARQQALDDMDTRAVEPDPVLDDLVDFARGAFALSIAAIITVDGSTQRMKAASGIRPVLLPRDGSFADITIRTASHHVVTDAAANTLHSRDPLVTGHPYVRFYAGYPIESPEGRRIGVLCVMDTKPRSFAAPELELLRTLAQRAQERLWLERAD